MIVPEKRVQLQYLFLSSPKQPESLPLLALSALQQVVHSAKELQDNVALRPRPLVLAGGGAALSRSSVFVLWQVKVLLLRGDAGEELCRAVGGRHGGAGGASIQRLILVLFVALLRALLECLVHVREGDGAQGGLEATVLAPSPGGPSLLALRLLELPDGLSQVPDRHVQGGELPGDGGGGVVRGEGGHAPGQALRQEDAAGAHQAPRAQRRQVGPTGAELLPGAGRPQVPPGRPGAQEEPGEPGGPQSPGEGRGGGGP